MSFTEQLKNARLNMGLTQQQVADRMGVTKSTYCGYETGKRQPDVAKIKQLADILNTSGDTLLETGFVSERGANNLKFVELDEADVVGGLDINEEVKQLAKQYSLLSDKDRELVKNMIDSLSEKIERRQPNDDEPK